MLVRINGTKCHLEPLTTIGTFLEKNGLAPETVVVELNGGIIATQAYASTEIREQDCLEVLTFVGGG
ncbi:MAG: sulfur carrier protein ThiS [Pseudomonadota bacterium]